MQPTPALSPITEPAGTAQCEDLADATQAVTSGPRVIGRKQPSGVVVKPQPPVKGDVKPATEIGLR